MTLGQYLMTDTKMCFAQAWTNILLRRESNRMLKQNRVVMDNADKSDAVFKSFFASVFRPVDHHIPSH